MKKRNGDARRLQLSTAQEKCVRREQRRVGIHLSRLSRNFRESRDDTVRTYVSIFALLFVSTSSTTSDAIEMI